MRTAWIGGLCFLLGITVLAVAQTTGLRPDQFVAMAWTWTKSQAVTPVALTDGSSVAVDASLSNSFTLTVTGNSHTLANPTNVKTGQAFQFSILQDGSGHTGFATDTNYKYAGGTAPTWSTAASKKDIISCWADTATTLNCAAMIDVH